MLVGVDIALLAACVVAARRNVTLQSVAATDEVLLAPIRGVVAPALEGTDLQGSPEVVRYELDRRPTLVYTFTANCQECEGSWRALRSVQALAPSSLRIFYVDITDTLKAKFLADRGIPASSVFAGLAPVSRIAYGARVVPQAELLDRDGRVVWGHVGLMRPEAVNELLSAIGESDRN
ncbi:MAG: TlpA family protein disulfide reductase [Terriglobales bacterium]